MHRFVRNRGFKFRPRKPLHKFWVVENHAAIGGHGGNRSWQAFQPDAQCPEKWLAEEKLCSRFRQFPLNIVLLCDLKHKVASIEP